MQTWKKAAVAVIVFLAIIAAVFVALYKRKEMEVDTETGRITERS